jgi:serine/threonine-protein kinase RsbW
MPTLRQVRLRNHAGPHQAAFVERVLLAAPRAVPQARGLVTSALACWGLSAMEDDAALLTAELTANAVGQAEIAPPPEILVRVRRTQRYVVIAVGDHNHAGPPAPPRMVAETEEHGRGLLIADALAARLGWYLEDPWKIVWAALSRPQARSEPGSRRGQVGRAA